jgi:hypothetical protein
MGCGRMAPIFISREDRARSGAGAQTRVAEELKTTFASHHSLKAEDSRRNLRKRRSVWSRRAAGRSARSQSIWALAFRRCAAGSTNADSRRCGRRYFRYLYGFIAATGYIVGQRRGHREFFIEAMRGKCLGFRTFLSRWKSRVGKGSRLRTFFWATRAEVRISDF